MTLDEIQAEAKKLHDEAENINTIREAVAATKMAAAMIFYLAREVEKQAAVVDPILPKPGTLE